jgi:putative long chain acyl-CoA synthase
MRLGRLGAPYAAPYDIPHRDRVAGLRHYHTAGQPDARLAPVLLIPPLMVTSEVYDIAPELSAVQMLGAAGIDVWLVDFGAPERAEGGMERTLDDHVRAIGSALDFVREATGQKSVHLAGYSQGGMFGLPGRGVSALRGRGLAHHLRLAGRHPALLAGRCPRRSPSA